MPAAIQKTLDFESKLDRSPFNIQRLLVAGEDSAKRFLQERRAAISVQSIEGGAGS